MYKRLIATAFALLMVGCGSQPAPSSSSEVPEVPDVPSQEVTDAPADDDFLFVDMVGNPVALDSARMINCSLDYTYGWNMDAPGYVQLKSNSLVAGGTVIRAESAYLLGGYLAPSHGNYSSYVPKNPCVVSSVVILGIWPMTGILEVSARGITFHPYFDEKKGNLPLLHPRIEFSEREYQENSTLTISENETVTVQPTPIHLIHPTEGGILQTISAYLSGTATNDKEYLAQFENAKYLEAQILISSIQVEGYSQVEGEAIYRTVFTGILHQQGSSEPGRITILRTL